MQLAFEWLITQEGLLVREVVTLEKILAERVELMALMNPFPPVSGLEHPVLRHVYLVFHQCWCVMDARYQCGWQSAATAGQVCAHSICCSSAAVRAGWMHA